MYSGNLTLSSGLFRSLQGKEIEPIMIREEDKKVSKLLVHTKFEVNIEEVKILLLKNEKNEKGGLGSNLSRRFWLRSSACRKQSQNRRLSFTRKKTNVPDCLTDASC